MVAATENRGMFATTGNFIVAVRLYCSASHMAASCLRWKQNTALAGAAQRLISLEAVVDLPGSVASLYSLCESMYTGAFGDRFQELGNRYALSSLGARVAEVVGLVFENLTFIRDNELSATVKRVCKASVLEAGADVAYAISAACNLNRRRVKTEILHRVPKLRKYRAIKDVLTITNSICSLSGFSKTAKMCSIAGDSLKLYIAYRKQARNKITNIVKLRRRELWQQ